MIGQTISHYKIIEKLGEAQLRSRTRSFVERGGMGVVYKVPIRLDLTSEVKLSPFVGLRIPTSLVGTRRSKL